MSQKTWLRFFVVSILLILVAPAANGYEQPISKQFNLKNLAVPFSLRECKPGEPFQIAHAPFENLRIMVTDSEGRFWLASTNGAIRFDPRSSDSWTRWRVFAGKRWLADDDVKNIWINPNAPRQVWIQTAAAASLIDFQDYSLEKKTAFFEDRLQKRHVRHGLTADCALKIPGDISAFAPISTDNDGLWTAIYIAAECYRFAVTGAPEARRNAQRSIQALIRLETITGIPGFPARSFVGMNEHLPSDGEWHLTPDGLWRWKGDTSSDEIVGHYFAYAIYFDLAADKKEKEEIRRVVTRITDHIIDHGWNLIDVDGKPTTWGQWSEDYFDTEIGKDDQGLNALELLSFLKTAYHITGLPRYQAAYAERLAHGYAKRMALYRAFEINFSDDELAFLSWQPLLRYERDPKIRGFYLQPFEALAKAIRPDRNPLWNFMVLESLHPRDTPQLLAESRTTLERIPMDLVDWPVRNSNRKDIQYRPGRDRFGRRELTSALPPDERPVARWNSNPYYPDGGGGGNSEDDGAFFLLPYWLGRYHHWIK